MVLSGGLTHPITQYHTALHTSPAFTRPHLTCPAAGESPNDRNDRAIRRAAEWYHQRLSSRLPVIFLTNDRASRELAQAQGLHASGTAAYARTRVDAPDLLDIAARYEETEGDPMEQVGAGGAGGAGGVAGGVAGGGGWCWLVVLVAALAVPG